MARKNVKMKVVKRPQMSPERYIVQKGRSLGFYECLINGDMRDVGLAVIVISKQMPSGNFIIGLYLIDFLCLGLKNTYLRFNFSKQEYEEFVEMAYKDTNEIMRCDTIYAHDFIYGAIDYAKSLGFNPNEKFRVTEYLLDPDLISDDIDKIEFGKNGKPLFIQGENDNATRIINKLNETVGKGNYHYMRSGEDMEM